MNLVVDIGNTHSKFAWFEQGVMKESLRVVTDQVNFAEIVNMRHADMAIISSVGTEKNVIPLELQHLNKLVLLDHLTPLPFRISYRTPETLGHDRIAACAGAQFLYPGNHVLIFDLGTAITIDFINASGEYPGGNISPGLHTRFRSLHEFTAKLPLVERDGTFPEFGTDTRSAIMAGVQQGIIFELNGYMDDFTIRYPGCKFIITGGDAIFFVSSLKGSVIALPELVMTGLNHILEFNVSGGR